MQSIDERTDGAWRPGPGTIYPLLRSLVEEKMLLPSSSRGSGGKIAYSLTPRGKRELSVMQKFLASAGRKERVVVRLLVDLLPPLAMASMMINRIREGSDLLRTTLLSLPEPDRSSLIKELRLLSESQELWAESQLRNRPGSRAGGRAYRQEQAQA
jgi:DNA-binding PadR family transcriptional regulator